MEKWIPYLLGTIQVFVAVGALPAGLMMIWDPTGSSLGLSLEALSNSPFDNYLIPGITLFLVNGIAQLGGAILCFRKHPLHGKLGLLLGILLMGWILVQLYLLGLVSSLQVAFFVIGLLEVRLSLYAYRSQHTGEIQ